LIITLRGYPERTSGIECGIPAAGDQLNSRLEAAPTDSLSSGNLDFPDKHITLNIGHKTKILNFFLKFQIF
jgi:hypothetical protein